MKLEVKGVEEDKVKEKKFVPFKIEMLIESEEDLIDLWARFNFCTFDVNLELQDTEYPLLPSDFENSKKWKVINDLLKQKPYMK